MENKFEDLAKWANDGIELAQESNYNLEDLINMIEMAWHLKEMFNIMWDLKNKKDEE